MAIKKYLTLLHFLAKNYGLDKFCIVRLPELLEETPYGGSAMMRFVLFRELPRS